MVVGVDGAVGCFVGTVGILRLMAEVLAADILERNEVAIVAVPRTNKDVNAFYFIQSTADCGTPGQP